MTGMIGFNESLNFVQAPFIQNLVTVESCRDFVKDQLFWNKALQVTLVIAVIFIFYLLYKQGKFNKEKEALNKLG